MLLGARALAPLWLPGLMSVGLWGCGWGPGHEVWRSPKETSFRLGCSVRCSQGFHPHQPYPPWSPDPSPELQVDSGSRALDVFVGAPDSAAPPWLLLPPPAQLSLVRS